MSTSHPASHAVFDAPLDPALRQWLDRINEAAAAKPQPALTPQYVRDLLSGLTAAMAGEVPPAAAEQDAHIAIAADTIAGHATPARTVAVRLFDPAPGQARPVLVYLHGGGHTAGSVAVYTPILRRLAAATGQLVVAVDYRLAPEHPYPHALHDSLGVLKALPQWLADAGYAGHAASLARGCTLAGDSAGGALTATISAMATQCGDVAIAGQVLVYPSLDYTMEHASIQRLGHGYLLEKRRIAWYFNNYLPAERAARVAASPLAMPKQGLPPTLLITAGYCPLVDEGLAYAEHLRNAHVALEHLHVPDVVHACLNLHTLVPTQCEQIYAAIARFANRQ